MNLFTNCFALVCMTLSISTARAGKPADNDKDTSQHPAAPRSHAQKADLAARLAAMTEYNARKQRRAQQNAYPHLHQTVLSAPTTPAEAAQKDAYIQALVSAALRKD